MKENKIEKITDSDLQVDNQEVITTKDKKNRPFFLRVSFVFFIGLLVLGYLYYQKTTELNQIKSQMGVSAHSEEEIQEVTTSMKEHIIVAKDDEVKVLGIIDNPDPIRQEQVFYKDVEKGDYVFVFTASSRALIWRPSENKVVNFGVFEVKDDAPITNKTTPETGTSTKKK